MRRVSTAVALVAVLALLGGACTKSDTGAGDGTGGASTTGGGGGNSGAGGTSAGGSTSAGGAAAGEGGGGGTTATGGSGSGNDTGTGGRGGDGGNGGGGGTGGTSATGGSSGAGGSKGGSSGGGGGGGGGAIGSGGSVGAGGSGSSSCTFMKTSSTSSKIPTVGIVTWSTTLSSPTSAKIAFGLTTSYGLAAPVDLTQASYRTLLLGMKPSMTYHFQITASNASGQCVSPDYTIMTGALSGNIPSVAASPSNPSGAAGGFLITGVYNMAGSASPAFIVDGDGTVVWAYQISSDVTGAVMSYDGTRMWINGANVPSGTAHVHSVTMDGLTDDDDSSQFKGQNHQLTVLPDETVAFYAYGTNGCEDIKLRSPSGSVTTVVNAEAAHGGSGGCHVNNIQYSQSDDTLVFSDLDHNCITKVARTTGSTVWVLGGGIGGVTSTLTGASWMGGQHGIHVVGLNDFVIFNNNTTTDAANGTQLGGSGNGSLAIEVMPNPTAKTATQSWSYKANPGISNDVMGDVQRLANGNTIVAFSTQKKIQEVSSSGSVVQTLTFGSEIGYIQKRATLYGAPPR